MRDIKLLTPLTQQLHAAFAYEMARAGLNYIVTSTLRTLDEQTALYAQGREDIDTINRLRARVGMYLLKQQEAKQIVTWTMNSRHLLGTAFDIALVDKLGKAYWNEKVSINANEIADYLEAAEIGQKLGLTAGGLWAKPDFPHFEVPK